MSRLQELKDEYAKEMAYEDWIDLCFKISNREASKGLILADILLHNDQVTELYAEECCIKTLEAASKKACIEPKGMMTRVHKDSITNSENIVLL